MAEQRDADAVYSLASEFATSFVVDEVSFNVAFSRLLSDPGAFLAVAEIEGIVVGYILGFSHHTFYANGPVGWVEEIMVKPDRRRHRLGESLMKEFEQWCRERGCKLAALATRRASPFYKAIGYEESAAYFRKLL